VEGREEPLVPEDLASLVVEKCWKGHYKTSLKRGESIVRASCEGKFKTLEDPIRGIGENWHGEETVGSHNSTKRRGWIYHTSLHDRDCPKGAKKVEECKEGRDRTCPHFERNRTTLVVQVFPAGTEGGYFA